jgi:hypothetical protein
MKGMAMVPNKTLGSPKLTPELDRRRPPTDWEALALIISAWMVLLAILLALRV